MYRWLPISYSSSCCDEINACLNLGGKGLFGLQLYHTLHLEGGRGSRQQEPEAAGHIASLLRGWCHPQRVGHPPQLT